MAQTEVLLPKMGESVTEATIIKWLKSEGDTVEMDEAIVEIATDKVDSEIPCPFEGVLDKILVKEGEVVQVDSPIAIINDSKNTTDAAVSEEDLEQAEASLHSSEQSIAEPTLVSTSTTTRFYSPYVKSISKKEGISVEELHTITGTGKNQRVSKKDLLAYIAKKEDGVSKPGIEPASTSPASPAFPAGNTEIIPMDRMRKLIADHMVMSKQTSPHVTAFVEADVTNIVRWRNKIKQQFEEQEGEKITFTPIFIEAIVKAIKDLPMINVSVDGTNIIKKNYINIGMAAALPNGNLVVPVIKNADRYNLAGLAKTVNDITKRARNNQLTPDEIQDGTFTLTNVGTFGNVMGTPIINQPQVAILATGTIAKKPAVIETPKGDLIGIREMMFLSLSFDHRVVDGSLGGTFVRKVADYLEGFNPNREI